MASSSASSSDPSSSKNPPTTPDRSAIIEEVYARAREIAFAQKDAPIRRERILPSQRIDLDGRPGFATSGDWPTTRRSRGPIRIIRGNSEIPATPSAVDKRSEPPAESTMPTKNPGDGGAEVPSEKSAAVDQTPSAPDPSS